MEQTGRIQNGAVILDAPLALPDGTPVSVVVRTLPSVHVSTNSKRVEFPLVRSTVPGSVHLTASKVAEILEKDDLDSLKR